MGTPLSARWILLVSLGAASAACSDAGHWFCFSHCTDDVPSADAAVEAATLGAGGTTLLGGGGDDRAGESDASTALDAPVEACSADTATDPRNCGACGNVCVLANAFPKCVGGVCAVETCGSGHIDLNGIASDGCEYACTPTDGGVEICDLLDNDCDGVIDEGFDLQSDPQHCGSCDNACSLAHAEAACSVVDGTPTCVVASCADGYRNIDGLDANGCEYTCPVWPPVAEICNDKDDDCDGTVNQGNPGGGVACDSNCPGGVCKGECTSGVTLCVGSSLVCIAGKEATIEVCDGKDNDCDGEVDDGFDLATDPLNCGSCGHVCKLDHAVSGCKAGKCQVTVCQTGYGDVDGDNDNGCEYACPVVPVTVETCNGLDDDCNGVVDDATAIAAQKPTAAGCYPTANTPCAGADFACAGTKGWRCNYGADVEVDGEGKLVLVESRCDGKDGNCNGQIDESFADLGSSCDNGLFGACRDVGRRVCDPGDDTQTKCDLSILPDAVPGAPMVEQCNGVDDDCNGQIDDDIVDDMVRVKSGSLDFYIDRYEASRPDATSTQVGLLEERRCVNAGVLPWAQAPFAEAKRACEATGARLCTAAEMQAACEGASSLVYPYGNSYDGAVCNGLDYSGVGGGADAAGSGADAMDAEAGLDEAGGSVDAAAGSSSARPTGLAGCVSSLGVYDLSGNVAEWTSVLTGNTGSPLNLNIYEVFGGSYETPALGLTCQFALSRYASSAILSDVGFRCCRAAQSEF